MEILFPNITIGPSVISAIRKYTSLLFDVHLMIKSPSKHIESFINAGADIITVHAEAEIHLEKLIGKIKSYKNTNGRKKQFKLEFQSFLQLLLVFLST